MWDISSHHNQIYHCSHRRKQISSIKIWYTWSKSGKKGCAQEAGKAQDKKGKCVRACVCTDGCVQTQMVHVHSSKPLGAAATPQVTLRHFASGAQPGGMWGQETSRGFRPVPEHQAQCEDPAAFPRSRDFFQLFPRAGSSPASSRKAGILRSLDVRVPLTYLFMESAIKLLTCLRSDETY